MLAALLWTLLGVLAGLFLLGVMAIVFIGAAVLWVAWVGLGPDGGLVVEGDAA